MKGMSDVERWGVEEKQWAAPSNYLWGSIGIMKEGVMELWVVDEGLMEGKRSNAPLTCAGATTRTRRTAQHLTHGTQQLLVRRVMKMSKLWSYCWYVTTLHLLLSSIFTNIPHSQYLYLYTFRVHIHQATHLIWAFVSISSSFTTYQHNYHAEC